VGGSKNYRGERRVQADIKIPVWSKEREESRKGSNPPARENKGRKGERLILAESGSKDRGGKRRNIVLRSRLYYREKRMILNR